MSGIANEVRLFMAMSAFGLVAGTIYWFVSYEPIGTILLGAFGVAAGAAAVFVRRTTDDARTRAHARVGDGTEPSATDQAEPVPAPGWAPFGFAVGVAALAFGAAFGAWLTITGLLVVVVSGRTWLSMAMYESDVARGEIADGARGSKPMPTDEAAPRA